MNVSFHTLVTLATAAVLSSRQERSTTFTRHLPVITGFAVGIIFHGVLDYLPHNYPINSAVDVLVSLLLFGAAVCFSSASHRLLLSACFLGTLLPDLVDLGPAILKKRPGWELPVVKLFPWHWPQYSGSIYDATRSVESLLYHVLVVGVCLWMLYAVGGSLLRKTQ